MATYSDHAIVRTVLRGRLHGQLCENVWYLRTKVANSVDENIAINDARDHIWNAIKPNVSNEYLLEVITVQEIFPNPTDPYLLIVNATGTLDGPAIPTLVAAVISLKTGFGGRRNRGRKYIAGLLRDEVDNSRVDDVRVNGLSAAAGSIVNWFLPTNALAFTELGIVHRRLNGQPVPLSNDSFVNVTLAYCNPFLGSMRSRNIGHGS